MLAIQDTAEFILSDSIHGWQKLPVKYQLNLCKIDSTLHVRLVGHNDEIYLEFLHWKYLTKQLGIQLN